jgi:signal transduction histidine kinase
MDWAEAYEDYQLDELPMVFSAMVMVFAWLSWRRSREYQRESVMRRTVETELLLNTSRLNDLLAATSDRFWETDTQHRIVWRSAPAGRTARDDNLLNKTRWESLGVDPAADKHWAAYVANLENRRPFRDFRYSKLQRGQIVHRSVAGKPFYDADGNFKGYRGTATNITDSVKAAAKADELQRQFLSAIESITDGYALWNADDTLITCNERFAALSNGAPHLIQPGATFEAFIRGSGLAQKAPGGKKWIEDCLARRRTSITPHHVRHDSGWIEMREHHLTDGRILTVTRDITQQKEMEQQLQQSQKLKAVGQLTGGIAHDFNNLLQVIIGNIELINEEAPAGSQMANQAKIAKMAADRGADLIRRLMAFSRQQALQPRAFDLNHMVSETGELMRRLLGADIEIHSTLGSQLSPVFLDPAQAEAAFINIAINARDAMPQGGTLFIETTEVIRSSEESDQLEIGPGRYVVLSITDTGSGMSPEILARVYEPFFTTKDIGQGTGLGLSTIYGFVKQSGGDVKIYSEPGIGTAVKLYLPTAEDHQVAGKSKDDVLEPVLGGTETVLLVEDEDMVRIYAAEQLRQLGYQVIAAANAQEAMERIADVNGCVDLLFTDIIMPGHVNGRKLARDLTTTYPHLKVLYTSGYNEKAIIHAGRLEPGITLLEKPYHRAELARKLRHVLDEKTLRPA